MKTTDLFLYGGPLVLLGFGVLAQWYSSWSMRRWRAAQRMQGPAE